MSGTKIQVGESPVAIGEGKIDGDLVKVGGESFYRITHYDKMPAFFMTLVSPGDQWLFIASNGGMTAGRKNSQSSLFPYYTVDKLIDSTERTGAKTMFRLSKNGKQYLWEPFSGRYLGLYSVRRNLYKNKLGNRIRFEEINEDLELQFIYEWTFSDTYGFVLSHELKSLSETENLQVEVLSGIQNLLPSGVNPFLQNTQSTLVDAYRKNELDEETGLGIFSLSSIIVDRAEPSEALRANTVWSRGLPKAKILLSIEQMDKFRKREEVEQENELKATKGAYFANAEMELQPQQKQEWKVVAEVDLSVRDVTNLREELLSNSEIEKDLQTSVEKGDRELWRLVALADGSQMADHPFTTGRHFSNVLYNIMRGGIFESEYQIGVQDFKEYARQQNPKLYKQHTEFFDELSAPLKYQDLLEKAENSGVADLNRISLEYLPLAFSRRHGDPSRPWNQFNIEGPDDKGKHRVNYEGNWRDIFQNWEALAYSFPAFIEGMITKFLNASTADGYNPYRITKAGIDWEVVEPDNPWSFIGYWGDHQIIYLLRLLEHCEKHYPGKLSNALPGESFVYANVPYRIKTFEDILKDPKDTIRFDDKLEAEIKKRCTEFGTDGKLIWKDGQLLYANLAEKLLLTGLTKFYNFIPDGGIWMNTQRPEWNDANNALVGNGVSMVTLYHLRRYFAFLKDLLKSRDLKVNEALGNLASEIKNICENHKEELGQPFSPQSRFSMVQALGQAGEAYRKAAYQAQLTARSPLKADEVEQTLNLMLEFIDDSIAKNRREDGLYHSYNLLEIKDGQAHISELYEMLEGQVAILNAGVLDAAEALELLDNLKNSKIYREDQYSYLLYPERELPSFLNKNTVPAEFCRSSELVQALRKREDGSLVEEDVNGKFHFNGDLRNAKEVQQVLNKLKETDLAHLVEKEQEEVLEVFERVFKHKSFTGRSGTFFAYEGLGSIYWHMVSKLLLAVQENIWLARDAGADQEVTGRLIDYYYEIRAGIGYNKNPELYGAFPTDAYSHTPKHEGAKQPGMTGQVKEDIINRWAELGIRVNEGKVSFDPFFWNQEEFLSKKADLNYLNEKAEIKQLELSPGEMAFTYCGCVIRYKRGSELKLRYRLNGDEREAETNHLPEELSQQLFDRTKNLSEIILEIPGS